ncbi:protein dead ringer isoform X2 [Nasonia vitripennis]|uniref:Protein dead ringer n=1 Tax=Nasonia vitripennis TaxID=7425 RepID=A0A7M7HAS6_NASVI|nr:protein dead ringer isoform X2 [Nasonia vitripennis]
MEILDEYQDSMGQPVPGDVANMASMAHHRHTPDSPMSHQEEDLSDPDRQDEESGEELPQQPLQANNHSSADNTPVPTPLSHLNSLMSSSHPHFLAKIKLENEMDLLNNKSGLEALQAVQAAMGGGGFNLPFSFPNPSAFLVPNQQHAQLAPGGMPLNPSSNNNNNNNSSSSSSNNNQNLGVGGGNNVPSSASSHSSESSQGSGRNGSVLETANRESVPGGGAGSVHSQSGSQAQQAHQQQTSWSFEEQFKQLYEINDDPKRKEFLDDLFSFMQKRGTPINRLPIMAKSVLDLYELYNLVIARGGLVDVINKKLWQEIIKGLHLPSSITSAAFTLRTQYMKYLYPYECEKKHLSTPGELQAAIDGNRREGRRSNYGAYGGGGEAGQQQLMHHQRSPHAPSSLASLHQQISPLSLVSAAVQQAAAASGQHQVGPQNPVNGSAAHTPLLHHPHHPQHSQTPVAGMAPEFEAHMAEYVKRLQHEMRVRRTSPNRLIHRQGSASPPPARSPSRDAAILEMSRFTLWNMYNNNLHPGIGYPPSAVSPQNSSHSPPPQPGSPEPQKEALDLGLRSSPGSSSPARQSPPSSGGSIAIKRELELTSGTSASKRLCMDEDGPAESALGALPALPGTHIKISNRGDGRDNSLVVSMELNGVMYQGVLFAQTDGRASVSASTNNNETKASTRNVVS